MRKKQLRFAEHSSLIAHHSSLFLQFRYWFAIGNANGKWSAAGVARLPPRRTVDAMFATGRAIFRFFPKAPEDHLAGSCLEHTGYGNVGVLANQPACVIHHDHRAIVKVSNALIVF